VWDIPALAGRAFRDERVAHPTQKPLAICERIVRHFAPSGGAVLVPFAGSGSECVAAHRLGRAFIGIELNPKYGELAVRRLIAEGWKPASSTPSRLEEDDLLLVA
jgi:site-specific DNA-methyltransferase (adenine-specific)/adenine-specific DNA-methyltransferase